MLSAEDIVNILEIIKNGKFSDLSQKAKELLETRNYINKIITING